MASHGKNRHLKRLASPVTWGVGRKGTEWAPKASPGAHKETESIPLLVVLREKLGLAENAREARIALHSGAVLVDGRKVRDENYAVGLMDVVSVPAQGLHYRVLVKGKKLVFTKIDEESCKVKYCKVLNKRSMRKGKVQLNLHDGRNYLVEKEEDRFKPGDTINVAVPQQKMVGFVKFEKGAKCFVYRGRHAGETGELIEVNERAGSKPADAKIKTANGELITLKDYLFVVDSKFKGIQK